MATCKHISSPKSSPLPLLEYISRPDRLMKGKAPENDIVRFAGNCGTELSTPFQIHRQFDRLLKECKPYNNHFERRYTHLVISFSFRDSQKYPIALLVEHLYRTMARAFPGTQWTSCFHMNRYLDRLELVSNGIDPKTAELILDERKLKDPDIKKDPKLEAHENKKGGHKHWHIIINMMMLNGKLFNAGFCQERLRRASDAVAKELGMSVLPTPVWNKAITEEDYKERSAKKKGKPLIKTIIRDKLIRLSETYKEAGKFDIKDWQRRLNAEGITLYRAQTHKNAKTVGLIYQMPQMSEDGFKASRFGSLFQLSGIKLMQELGKDEAIRILENREHRISVKKMNETVMKDNESSLAGLEWMSPSKNLV